jgi:hypothetical protein
MLQMATPSPRGATSVFSEQESKLPDLASDAMASCKLPGDVYDTTRALPRPQRQVSHDHNTPAPRSPEFTLTAPSSSPSSDAATSRSASTRSSALNHVTDFFSSALAAIPQATTEFLLKVAQMKKNYLENMAALQTESKVLKFSEQDVQLLMQWRIANLEYYEGVTKAMRHFEAILHKAQTTQEQRKQIWGTAMSLRKLGASPAFRRQLRLYAEDQLAGEAKQMVADFLDYQTKVGELTTLLRSIIDEAVTLLEKSLQDNKRVVMHTWEVQRMLQEKAKCLPSQTKTIQTGLVAALEATIGVGATTMGVLSLFNPPLMGGVAVTSAGLAVNQLVTLYLVDSNPNDATRVVNAQMFSNMIADILTDMRFNSGALVDTLYPHSTEASATGASESNEQATFFTIDFQGCPLFRLQIQRVQLLAVAGQEMMLATRFDDRWIDPMVRERIVSQQEGELALQRPIQQLTIIDDHFARMPSNDIGIRPGISADRAREQEHKDSGFASSQGAAARSHEASPLLRGTNVPDYSATRGTGFREGGPRTRIIADEAGRETVIDACLLRKKKADGQTEEKRDSSVAESSSDVNSGC